MSTPVDEVKALQLEDQKENHNYSEEPSPTSDDDTYVNEYHENNHLKLDTICTAEDEAPPPMRTPSSRREHATRLEDDLMLLQAERVVSRSTQGGEGGREDGDGPLSINRSRSRRSETVDEFDEATNPLHEKAAIYKPPESPNTKIAVFIKRVHESSFIVRYFTYITPLFLILLIPLLLGALQYKNASVGGVRLMWFSIWLEIVWLTLWAGRVSGFGFENRSSFSDEGYRLLVRVCLCLLECQLASLPTTQRSGVIWPSSSSFMLRSSSGGWPLRFRSCPR